VKILLIGKTGQLGSSILSTNTLHEIVAPDRTELDIEDGESIYRIIQDCRPDAIINTAAFHNVLQCEVEPQRAFTVNTVAVQTLALACKKAHVLFIWWGEEGAIFGK
jgi:dTDP-4-dehydrorhamnose reductase